MKVTGFIFSLFLLLGTAFSAGAAIRNTYHVPGKALARLKGFSVQIMGFANGTPQLNLTNPNERFGGIAVNVDGKPVKGTRRDEGQVMHYDFPDEGVLTMKIMKDKRVSFEGRFPNAKKLSFEIPMLAKFFSGTKVAFDGKVKTVPARQQNPKGNFIPLFKGTPAKVKFFAGKPEAFEFEFDGTTNVRVGHFTKGNNAVVLNIAPADPSGEFSFILDPGTR